MRNCLNSVAAVLLAVAGALVITVPGADAAPQVLALIATEGEVELNCRSGECSAELSAFCLQSNRYSPVRGTRYQIAGGNVRLVGTNQSGRVVALDAAKYLTFESLRTHVAVRVAASRQEIAELGLDRVRVIVDANSALAPVASAGDPDPQTPEEIAVLVGSLRRAGSQVVDGNADRMAAARITNKMINALPAQDQEDKPAASSLWDRVHGRFDDSAASASAQEMAQDAYRFCDFLSRRNTLRTVRRCLQTQHDNFVNYLNAEYWDVTQPGS